MQINPYLFFDSNCEAAFKFYEKALGGKIEMLLRNEDAPPDSGMPSLPERKQKIMHAKMSIDGQILMASDAPPSHFQKPQGFAISITIKDVAEAERKFKALSEGGSANMPFGKTFFSKGFGMCVDQFGISWMVNCPAAGM
jgi:PhnB protein